MDTTVSTSLANNALQKIASGTPLSKLTPTEQQAVGALPPSALNAAMTKRIAPDAYVSPVEKNQMKSPDPTMDAGLNNPIKSKPEPQGPTGLQKVFNYAGRDQLGFKTTPGYAGTVDTSKLSPAPPMGNSMEDNGVVGKFGSGNEKYAGTAAYQGSGIVDPPTLNIPPPPAALTASQEAAPAEGRKETGADLARANEYIPPSSMPAIPKDMSKAKLMDLLVNIMDAVGGGMQAYGGVQSPTRLMQQGKMNMQVKAQQQAAQNQADIEYEQRLKLLPVEAQNAIAQARAIGDIKKEQDIATQYGIEKAVNPVRLEQIAAGRRPAIGNMGVAGQNLVTGGQ